MKSSIRELAKNLRSYAKRCKNVKYSINLLITFLLAGKIVVPNSNNDLVNKNEDKDVNKNEKVLKKVKKNNSLIQNTNNELIQLVANGDKAINFMGETGKTKADYSFEIERMNNSIVTESNSKEGTIFSMGIEPSKLAVKSLVDKGDSASLLVSANKNAITTDKNILSQKQTITNSISDIRMTFKKAKSENNNLLKNANLELVQLMEQGDQVVKLPWSSWQFGMNYFFNTFNGTYNGRGDKKEYEIIYRNSKGKDSLSKYMYNNSFHSGVNYNLTNLNILKESEISVEIEKIIKPKIVEKDLQVVSIDTPQLIIPNIKPKTVILPTVPNRIYVQAPEIFDPPSIIFVGKGFSQSANIKTQLYGHNNGRGDDYEVVSNFDTYKVVDKNTDKETGTINIEIGHTLDGNSQRFMKWYGTNDDGTPNSDIQMKLTTNVPSLRDENITDGNFNLMGGAGTYYLDNSGENVIDNGTPLSMRAFINEVRDHNPIINGNYILTHKGGGVLSSNHNTIFLSYNPAGIGESRVYAKPGETEYTWEAHRKTGKTATYDSLSEPGPKTLTFNANLTLNGITSNDTIRGDKTVIGVEHQLWKAEFDRADAYSVFDNRGKITINSGRGVVALLIDVEKWQNPRQDVIDKTKDKKLKEAFEKDSRREHTYNNGLIEIGKDASESIGIDYGEYQYLPLKSILYLGDVIVGGKDNYGFRMANIFKTKPDYFDKGV